MAIRPDRAPATPHPPGKASTRHLAGPPRSLRDFILIRAVFLQTHNEPNETTHHAPRSTPRSRPQAPFQGSLQGVLLHPHQVGGPFTPAPPPPPSSRMSRQRQVACRTNGKSHVAPTASRMSHSRQAGPPSLPGDPSHLPPSGFLIPPAQVPPGAYVAVQGRDAAVLADNDTLGPAEGKRPLVVPLKDIQDPLVPLARGRGLLPQPAEQAPPITGPWPGATFQQGLLVSSEPRETQNRRRALPARCMVRAVHVKSPPPPLGEDP
jgi:hypothetical protein